MRSDRFLGALVEEEISPAGDGKATSGEKVKIIKRRRSNMKSIDEIDVTGKRVLVRVDFNVPLNEQSQVRDDLRIREVLPTLRYLIEKKARVILASHLGGPEGKKAPEFSLRPVAVHLSRILGQEVGMAPDCIGYEVETQVARLKTGQVLLLENLRFHAEEEKDDDAFAASLAALCDIYVNDAFAVSHRANASVSAITRHAPLSVAGFLLKREITYADQVLKNPKRPFVAVVGGAKVSTKLKALEKILERVDKLILGGAMANTFLAASGKDVGRSKVEPEMLTVAADIIRRSAEKRIPFYLPVDGVAADRATADATIRMVPVQEVPAEWMILDIGPASLSLYSQALYDAKTIVWNGPMGVFELDAFSRGTLGMVHCLAQCHALTVVGGGETGEAVYKSGLAQRISYISTGGGAFLELMEGKELPGIAALKRSERGA